jgi:hypothetical protein
MQNSITALAPMMCVAIYVILKSSVSAWRSWRLLQQQRPQGVLRRGINRLLRRI